MPKICIIDHARKAIYFEASNYVAINSTVSAGVNYLIRDQNFSLARSSIKTIPSTAEQLETAIRQGHRIYDISGREVEEIYAALMSKLVRSSVQNIDYYPFKE
jgi:hypothetical protein